jgi:glutathione peroxidase
MAKRRLPDEYTEPGGGPGEVERLGQARFDNPGRFYGGYASEVDDHARGGRDTTGPLAAIIEATSLEPPPPMTTFFDFDVTGIDGARDFLRPLRGRVVLAVNVASRCGLTPQYTDLEGLHEELAGEGFAVVGFPCNQFGAQEPGSEQEIATFCETNYDVTFPLFAKIDVNGDTTAPLYRYLKHEKPGLLGTEAIKWNFTKFLVDRGGKVVARYAPNDTPEALEPDVARAL